MTIAIALLYATLVVASLAVLGYDSHHVNGANVNT